RGFGLSSAVFPDLRKPGLTRILGPYVAPEVRPNGAVGEQSDIYSLGVFLSELLTARPASLEGPPEFSPEYPFSEDVGRVVQRLGAVGEVRLRLQRLIEDCPYERSNADLALDLDDLLKPENGARGPRAIARVFPMPRPWPRSAEPGATRSIWALRIVSGVAAILLLAVVDLAVRTREAPLGFTIPRPKIVPARRPEAASPRTALIAADSAVADSLSATSPDREAPPRPSAARTAANRALHHERQLAQLWRFRAAFSRVAAERIDAPDLASDSFREARIAENEGARLL